MVLMPLDDENETLSNFSLIGETPTDPQNLTTNSLQKINMWQLGTLLGIDHSLADGIPTLMRKPLVQVF